MGEFLRNNWFVVVIAVILISFIGYFIFDANRYNVSGKTMDGKEVVASIDGTDVTADDLYNELEVLTVRFYTICIAMLLLTRQLKQQTA